MSRKQRGWFENSGGSDPDATFVIRRPAPRPAVRPAILAGFAVAVLVTLMLVFLRPPSSAPSRKTSTF